jgi:flagellar FliL protein
MSTAKLILAVVGASLLSVGIGGSGMWWLMNKSHAKSEAEVVEEPAVEVVDTRAFKYISLDKIIVMLRNSAGEPVSHYLALDLVFSTPIEAESTTKAHLPLLRSIAVSALSQLTVQSAGMLTVDELTQRINDAYTEAYANDPAGKPFARAMISKLIIE